MASLQIVQLTIPSGASASNALSADSLRNCRGLSIQAPATYTGTSVVVQSANSNSGSSWTTVQSPPGTDITVAANKTTVLVEPPFPQMRLLSDGAEAADRVFNLCLSIGE